MTRSLLFLAPLALLVGACSSTQSAQRQDAQPVAAKPAGTVVTEWGNLPAYSTGYKVNPLAFSTRLPTPTADYYRAEFDLLVERDGTVRDVSIHTSSEFPEADQAIAAQFRAARSRLVLAPSDPAPYVIRYTLVRNWEMARRKTYTSSPNDWRFHDNRPMGTGAPYWGRP